MADCRPWSPAGEECRPGLAATSQPSRDCKCSHGKARVLGTLAGPIGWATQQAGPAPAHSGWAAAEAGRACLCSPWLGSGLGLYMGSAQPHTHPKKNF
ncbi:hypothetical protein TIFTF001_044490 [Ficus carica]|uniref:Uncharacterized protein n=1 Tax=Ficus carica TaxID=3494 RepID=A0AA88CT33_FICCA|nr:hypothetical protein TIFTF001_044490 [Ficus carica]